jgi:hypothetical protein
MEKFTSAETERLNGLLSVEINPFLNGDAESVKLPLGKTTQDWLFRTYINMPVDAQQELQDLLSDDVDDNDKVMLLSEILEERQVSSAPQWWELNFFEADISGLWKFFAEQCRNNYSEEENEYFDQLLKSLDELDKARQVVRVSEINKEKFSEDEVRSALEIVDK